MKLFKLGLFSLVLVGLFLFLYFQNIKRQVQLIKISPVQISQLEDGQYYGSYQVGPVYVESQTSIQAGEMTAVEILRHDNGLGDEAEIIIDQIIAEQSLDVDVISGATASSKAILKSIELAIEGAS